MNQATKQYINDQELAEMIGMSRNWLQIMRVRGGGPPFIKIGASCRYDLAEVSEWLETRRCHSTSDPVYKQARKADNFPLRHSRRSLKDM
jgi:predicted DNA-binding transcriptional regulator AlpA